MTLSFGAVRAQKTETNTFNLNGTWIPVKQEIGGRDLPAAAFEKYKLIMTDSIYIYSVVDQDKGVIKYSNGKMDIYGKEGPNAGKHYTAIYKLEKGQLIICYNLAGDSYPEGCDTKVKPTLFLSVYNKQ